MEVETRYSNDIYQQFGVTLPTDSSRYVLTNIYGFFLIILIPKANSQSSDF